MSISRREFFYLLGGVGLGATLSNADRIAEGFFLSDSKIGIRACQIAEYFRWLQKNDAISELEIRKYATWGSKDAIVAINQREDIEMIIPYRPVVTKLSLIGLDTVEESGSIKLVNMVAELPDWKDGERIPGPRFFTANLHQSERLSDLPPMKGDTTQSAGYVDFDEIVLWTNKNSLRTKNEVLERLRFGVFFSYVLLNRVSDGLKKAAYVLDDNIFKDASQALGTWSKHILEFDMTKPSSEIDSDIKNDYLARIVKVSLSDDISSEPTDQKFRYYMV